MYQLLQFISRQRAFILFVFLEVFSLWLFYKYNNYANAVYFNTSNYYIAKGLEAQNSVREFANLRQVNLDLATENARLHQQVAALEEKNLQVKFDYKADSMITNRFKTSIAKVIYNNFNNSRNIITIDKGLEDGMKPGMGVISATGVVGKILNCSPKFSTIITILHVDNMLSGKVKRSGEIGTVRWDGFDPYTISMDDVSRFKSVKLNDTVVTSDYNRVFPPNIMVGIVKKLGVQEDQAHHEISLKLATDFKNLSYVYIINNMLKDEQEKLETPPVLKK